MWPVRSMSCAVTTWIGRVTVTLEGTGIRDPVIITSGKDGCVSSGASGTFARLGVSSLVNGGSRQRMARAQMSAAGRYGELSITARRSLSQAPRRFPVSGHTFFGTRRARRNRVLASTEAPTYQLSPQPLGSSTRSARANLTFDGFVLTALGTVYGESD
jgi:hypothetical protein